MSMREIFHAQRIAPGENPGMDALEAVIGGTTPDAMSYLESSRNTSRWGDWRVSLVGSSTWWVEGQSGTKQYIIHVLPEHRSRGVYVWRPHPFFPPRPIRPLPEKAGREVLDMLERDLRQFGSKKAEWPSAQDLFGERAIYLAPGERFEGERKESFWREESILGAADEGVIPYWISLQGGAQQFYSRGLVIRRMEQEQIPAWADEAVGYELREGELYVFPDGSCRFVYRQWRNYVSHTPIARQGDCLIFELDEYALQWAKHYELGHEYSNHLGNHYIRPERTLDFYHWEPHELVDMPNGIGIALKGSGKVLLEHPEHEPVEVELKNQIVGILLAPGTSRPFQQNGGD